MGGLHSGRPVFALQSGLPVGSIDAFGNLSTDGYDPKASVRVNRRGATSLKNSWGGIENLLFGKKVLNSQAYI